ncbi:MAG: type IV toxin-antitoxin system AbiEi family antitoxin domain-containing protein [Actinobacteria bacterium]|nr:type IV toxin-antitoxin system AbiEi family antitoxin domain-containing protein [Actinomycetota bacterium]
MAVDDREWVVMLGLQRGVISRSQAFEFGISATALKHRLRRGGPWQRLLPGVYLTVTGTPTWEQLQTAALLHAGADSLITGPAALRNYGIRGPGSRVIDVLVPAERQATSQRFVAIHRTRRLPQTVSVDWTLRFAPPERAVADTVRQLTALNDARAVVASAVQQQHCTIEQLAAELRAGPIRHSARLRLVLAEVIDGIRSPAEAEFRQLITRSSLPQPLFNPKLFLGETFLAQPDAWWPDHGVAVEVDSREWHLLPAHWEHTMARDRRMAAAGINALHVSPRQVRDESADVLSEIEAALLAGRPLPAITTRPLAA